MPTLVLSLFGNNNAESVTETEYYSTLLDGPCWKSLQKKLPDQRQQLQEGRRDAVGHLQVVTGQSSVDGSAVVGMLCAPKEDDDESNDDTVVQLKSGEALAAYSVAKIPSNVKAAHAAFTYAYTVTHVYPLLNQLDRVGGVIGNGGIAVTTPQHVVVIGGNEDAILAAKGLQSLGVSKVTMVTTQNPKIESSSASSIVKVTKADAEIGFAEEIGTFDAILDTVDVEMEMDENAPMLEGPVIRLLRQRHQCRTYMTTYTRAQQIIGEEGMFFGPNKVKQYQADLISNSKSASSPPVLTPPAQIGATVQTLLDHGVIWKNDKQQQQPFVRGWDLNRFMEQTVWPTDSRGAASTRYGFPVPGDLSLDYDENDHDNENENSINGMLSEAPLPKGARLDFDNDDDDQKHKGEDSLSSSSTAGTGEQYIRSVIGYKGLTLLETQEVDCVLFLSARWCRTCKKMQLPFRRMARLNNEDLDGGGDLVFAKGEASGRDGKMLGRTLGVESVPTFVLFRKGKPFGKPITVNRLPSEKLETAINYLKQGKEWNDELFADEQG
eukprot:CAMPEP_0198142122 /NCGR_PEP_ID=MMETSP1443-20131203/5011_1 /TAXON_ID=186043 /ORGANISM="Entomoneis sp., Strain CCMP2396" /LENGTH=550 /DNA_ID=CAMNT_0043805077 /DNA_START=190 /DNA_END=1838 /DNA_ORIENTATION=+